MENNLPASEALEINAGEHPASPVGEYTIPDELFNARDINPQAKLVYAYLLRQSRRGVPSYPREVSETLGISSVSLWRHRKALEKHGYLEPVGVTIRIRRCR